MTLQVSQDNEIEVALLEAVDKHPEYTKTDIITAVVDELGVPRPTVRRAKIGLLKKLHGYVGVLT